MFNSIIGIYDFCLEKEIKFTHGGNNISYAIKFKKNFGSCSNCVYSNGIYTRGVMIEYENQVSNCIVDKSINITITLSDFSKDKSDKLMNWFINNNYEYKCSKSLIKLLKRHSDLWNDTVHRTTMSIGYERLLQVLLEEYSINSVSFIREDLFDNIPIED